jgi:pilus assembly protein Flp/PilA
MRFLRKFRADERGATAIEYTLLLSLLGLVLLAALSSIGLSLGDIFNTAGNAMAGS